MSQLENQEIGEPEKKKPRGKPFQKGNTFGCGPRQKKESLSLPKYIKKQTGHGKVLTDFYIGILKAVDDSDEDNPPVYRGMKITAELSTKAVEWLGKNGWGTPSQRKPESDKPKRTREELKHRLRFLIRKVVKDKDKAEHIIEHYDEVGL